MLAGMTAENVVVTRRQDGEHQLSVVQSVHAGEVAFAETPLVSVPLGHYVWGTYTWDLVDRLLSDRELLRSYMKLKLLTTPFLMDATDEAIESALVQQHKKSRQLVRDLYFSVGTNNIVVLDDERLAVGYGLYARMSRVDHSCDANTSLQGLDVHQAKLGLVAKRDIAAGEALTWCYFREDEFAGADYETRNLALVNVFRFACRCSRCEAERPAHLRGRKDLVAYFDGLIAEQARAMGGNPQALLDAVNSEPMVVHARALEQRRLLG
jgi:hypothetical protein